MSKSESIFLFSFFILSMYVLSLLIKLIGRPGFCVYATQVRIPAVFRCSNIKLGSLFRQNAITILNKVGSFDRQQSTDKIKLLKIVKDTFIRLVSNNHSADYWLTCTFNNNMQPNNVALIENWSGYPEQQPSCQTVIKRLYNNFYVIIFNKFYFYRIPLEASLPIRVQKYCFV